MAAGTLISYFFSGLEMDVCLLPERFIKRSFLIVVVHLILESYLQPCFRPIKVAFSYFVGHGIVLVQCRVNSLKCTGSSGMNLFGIRN
jgi:hypothetical protein